MVGRGEQLAGLRQLCDLACAGSPAVALLGGDAGVGKTRLITEFTAGLVGSAVLLSGGCVDLGGAGLAYAPFTAALRGLVRQLGAEDVASLLPGGGLAELGRLPPALGVSSAWPGSSRSPAAMTRPRPRRSATPARRARNAKDRSGFSRRCC